MITELCIENNSNSRNYSFCVTVIWITRQSVLVIYLEHKPLYLRFLLIAKLRNPLPFFCWYHLSIQNPYTGSRFPYSHSHWNSDQRLHVTSWTSRRGRSRKRWKARQREIWEIRGLLIFRAAVCESLHGTAELRRKRDRVRQLSFNLILSVFLSENPFSFSLSLATSLYVFKDWASSTIFFFVLVREWNSI